MSEDTEKDRFLREIKVAGDFTEAIDSEVVSRISYRSSGLDDYQWPFDAADDGDWPFVVVHDGREYEIDIDVHATELTDTVKAKRAAALAALRAQVDRQMWETTP